MRAQAGEIISSERVIGEYISIYIYLGETLMRAYIIAYSIILFFVAVGAVAFCLLYIRGQKRKIGKYSFRSSLQNEGEKAFLDIF